MMKNIYRLLVVILLAVLTALSCSPSKHCAKPELDMPDTFMLTDCDSTTIADMEWWSVYTDTLLQNLIKKALENNKDMLIASERVTEMRHMHKRAKADLWPSLSAKIGGDHEWENYGGQGMSSSPELTARLDLTWEIDLWGSLRWASKKGAAEYLSSVEAQRAMQMTLISEVAKAYFELIALDNQLQIVQQTLETRKEGVKQAKLRFEGGITSETSYQQAQVELATAASQIPKLERSIAIKESQISLLCGSYPDKVERKASKVTMVSDSEIPVGFPSYLLERRPDLRQAETRLRAAEAAVGVAQADRLPKFTINLAAGFENNEFKAFLQSPLLYAAGNIAAPLFSFGKRKARFKAAVSAYNQEKLAYEKTVMTAFKEVYDAVVIYRTARENTILMRELRGATKKYVELAQLQYINGVIRYIDVLDAQRKDFTAQIDLSNAISDESLAFVSLYKTLGGGW